MTLKNFKAKWIYFSALQLYLVSLGFIVIQLQVVDDDYIIDVEVVYVEHNIDKKHSTFTYTVKYTQTMNIIAVLVFHLHLYDLDMPI